MLSQSLYLAIGLVFVFEGLLPFLLPDVWRRTMQKLVLQSNQSLRLFGFVSMMVGLILLYWFKN